MSVLLITGVSFIAWGFQRSDGWGVALCILGGALLGVYTAARD